MLVDFRFGSIATFLPLTDHFRCAPINGHRQTVSVVPLVPNTDLAKPVQHVRSAPGSRHRRAACSGRPVPRSVNNPITAVGRFRRLDDVGPKSAFSRPSKRSAGNVKKPLAAGEDPWALSPRQDWQELPSAA
jgi:hypothetical protein